MSDKEICPKCRKLYVYSHHSNNKWQIKCEHCGYATEVYDTWKDARTEWDAESANKPHKLR